MSSETKKRLVVLNALPVNALPPVTTLKITKISLNELAALYKPNQIEIVHFIRHPATLSLLHKYLPLPAEPNAGLYTYVPGDVLLVATLRTPQRGAEVNNISIEDLDIRLVEVLQ